MPCLFKSQIKQLWLENQFYDFFYTENANKYKWFLYWQKLLKIFICTKYNYYIDCPASNWLHPGFSILQRVEGDDIDLFYWKRGNNLIYAIASKYVFELWDAVLELQLVRFQSIFERESTHVSRVLLTALNICVNDHSSTRILNEINIENIIVLICI